MRRCLSIDGSGSSSVGDSPFHLRRHHVEYVLTMIFRTYASGLPSIFDQRGHAFASAVWSRSSARCLSCVRRYAVRSSESERWRTKAANTSRAATPSVAAVSAVSSVIVTLSRSLDVM